LKSTEKFPEIRLRFFIELGFGELCVNDFKAVLQANAFEDIKVLLEHSLPTLSSFIIKNKNQKN
jgi:hypothetical protein